MFEWLLEAIGNFGTTINGSTLQINNTVTNLNNTEYVTELPMFQYLGAIHFVAGDAIWYTVMAFLLLGATVTIVRLVLGILRLVKDVKQTALF